MATETTKRMTGPVGWPIRVPARHRGHETDPWVDVTTVRCAACGEALPWETV